MGHACIVGFRQQRHQLGEHAQRVEEGATRSGRGALQFISRGIDALPKPAGRWPRSAARRPWLHLRQHRISRAESRSYVRLSWGRGAARASSHDAVCASARRPSIESTEVTAER